MATYTISPLSAPTRSLNIASSASITNGTQVNIYATSGSNDQNWVVDSLTSTSRQYIKHFSNQAYALNAYRSWPPIGTAPCVKLRAILTAT